MTEKTVLRHSDPQIKGTLTIDIPRDYDAGTPIENQGWMPNITLRLSEAGDHRVIAEDLQDNSQCRSTFERRSSVLAKVHTTYDEIEKCLRREADRIIAACEGYAEQLDRNGCSYIGNAPEPVDIGYLTDSTGMREYPVLNEDTVGQEEAIEHLQKCIGEGMSIDDAAESFGSSGYYDGTNDWLDDSKAQAEYAKSVWEEACEVDRELLQEITPPVELAKQLYDAASSINCSLDDGLQPTHYLTRHASVDRRTGWRCDQGYWSVMLEIYDAQMHLADAVKKLEAHAAKLNAKEGVTE